MIEVIVFDDQVMPANAIPREVISRGNLRLQFVVGFFQKFLGGDHAALVGAFADLAGFIVGGDGEGDDIFLHGGDLRLCPYLQTHGSGGEVGDVQRNAHGGLTLGDGFGNGLAGGALHQSYHTGGGVDHALFL